MTIYARRPIAILEAPSNLGLRPPSEGSVPGTYKMPWALRECSLPLMLGAADAGTVIPPRYEGAWESGDGTRNAVAIASYSRLLADRVRMLLRQGCFPLVLGGDCSILIGSALALSEDGPFGLVFIDAHTDFRHLGNSEAIQAAAGEDLAICTGRGDRRLVSLAGDRPLVAEKDVVVVGVRDNDEQLEEVAMLGMNIVTAGDLSRLGPEATAARVDAMLRNGAGAQRFWIHFDLDVVDDKEMWAVDSPEPSGPAFDLVFDIVGRLATSDRCQGMHITIYDPDLDPELRIAPRIAAGLATALGGRPKAAA